MDFGMTNATNASPGTTFPLTLEELDNLVQALGIESPPLSTIRNGTTLDLDGVVYVADETLPANGMRCGQAFFDGLRAAAPPAPANAKWWQSPLVSFPIFVDPLMKPRRVEVGKRLFWDLLWQSCKQIIVTPGRKEAT